MKTNFFLFSIFILLSSYLPIISMDTVNPTVLLQQRMATAQLLQAARQGNISLFESALEQGANENVKDETGKTAVDYAIHITKSSNNLEFALALMEKRAYNPVVQKELPQLIQLAVTREQVLPSAPIPTTNGGKEELIEAPSTPSSTSVTEKQKADQQQGQSSAVTASATTQPPTASSGWFPFWKSSSAPASGQAAAQQPPLSASAPAQPSSRSWLGTIGQTVTGAASTVGSALTSSASTVRSAVTTGASYAGQGLYTAGAYAATAGRYCLNAGLSYGPTLVKLGINRVQQDNYSLQQTAVNLNASLSDKERQFLALRKVKTQAGLEKLLNQPITNLTTVPNISFVFSGGGYRAMLETLGWLEAAEKTGLLDATQYVTGLSGSTWALFPWIASDLSVEQYKAQLITRINKSLQEYVKNMTFDELVAFITPLVRKRYDGHITGAVDLYGSLLAHMLLTQQDKQLFTLSNVAESLKEGKYPLPIATAATRAEVFTTNTPAVQPWFEFTPFNVGSVELNSFIPAWAFNRKFLKGLSLPTSKVKTGDMSTETPQYGREQSLGFLMGIWGSAFAFGMSDILQQLEAKLAAYLCGGNELSPMTKALLQHTTASVFQPFFASISQYVIPNPEKQQQYAALVSTYARLTSDVAAQYGRAEVSNLNYGIAGQWLNQSPTLTLVDGFFGVENGINMNLAIAPVLRPERQQDILIICDSSAILQGAPALRAAEAYARNRGFKFPRIHYQGIDTRLISVFDDGDESDTPVVIYIPAIANSNYSNFDPVTAAYTDTLNFAYTQQQSQELMGLTAYTLQEQIDVIKDVIQRVMQRKAHRRDANSNSNG